MQNLQQLPNCAFTTQGSLPRWHWPGKQSRDFTFSHRKGAWKQHYSSVSTLSWQAQFLLTFNVYLPVHPQDLCLSVCVDNLNNFWMLAAWDKLQIAITSFKPLIKTTGKSFSYSRAGLRGKGKGKHLAATAAKCLATNLWLYQLRKRQTWCRFYMT